MNLTHLLKLEWKRYWPNGTFRVIGVLYAGSFALVIFLARATGDNMTFTNNGYTSHPLAGLFDYPQNWKLLACIGSWMNMFLLGALGAFMITMEFSNRTLRQSVIFGMTRLEAAFSKLVWCVTLAVAVTGFYIFLAFGGEVMDGKGIGLPLAGSVLCFFLQALGYLLLGTLAGVLIRQAALAVLAYLAYVFILETVFRWVFYFTVAKTRLLLFLPNQVLGALTPLPVPESVTHLVDSNASLKSLSVAQAELAALAYLGIFALLFCRRIAKSDL
jgi:hypothetical protein